MDELKKKLEEMGRAFEEFKKINEQRLAEIKASGSASSATEEKLAKANADIDRLSADRDCLLKEMEEIKTAMNRGGFGEKADPSIEAKRLDQAYKAAFTKFMRTGEKSLSADEMKTLSTDSNADGGFLVRPELSNEIIKKYFESSPIAQLAEVIMIGSNALEMMVDFDEVSAGWTSERGTRANSATSKLSLLRIPAQEIYAEPAATQSMLEDAELDIEAWLQGKVQDKFSRVQATAFVTGTGQGQPRGFCTYPNGTAFGQIEQVNSGSSGAVTFDGLISLQTALKEPYQPGASWVMTRTTRGLIRKLKDSYGRYLWEQNLQTSGPEILLGKPVVLAADMAEAAAGSLSVAYGDFKQGYKVVPRKGISVLRDPFTSKPNVLFYTRARIGGDVGNSEAIKLQKLS